MRVTPLLFMILPMVFSCSVGDAPKIPADSGDATTPDVSADEQGPVDTGVGSTPPADTASADTASADTADSANPGIDTADSGSTGDTADSGSTADTADSGRTGDTADSGSITTVIDLDEDGFTILDGDCDDTDPTVYPEAEEVCDAIDNDCDEDIDEDAVDAVWSYADMDGDGYGDDRFAELTCDIPMGYVLVGGDCNDTNATTHPDAAERCDDVDNDCDTEVDEGVRHTWYADADGDGYGDLESSVESCDPGPGYVATSTDCDDSDPVANPGSYEICDGVDNNCDDAIDEDAVDATDWYPDADTDGFGTGVAVRSCDAPEGHVDNADDCNDEDATVNPDAAEVCDEADTDEDCSGLADDADGRVVAATTSVWYRDSDSDGYGDVLFGLARCDAPAGYVDAPTDCNDEDASVNPGATETCNGADDDCDGDTDEEDAIGMSTWYADDDGDGFGNPDRPTDACEAPAAHVADNTDCNDDDEGVSPAAIELCNEVDDNCDSIVDEDAPIWYADADADGYGDFTIMEASCDRPIDFVDNSDDCDDASPEAYPGAEEYCDGIDNDCDGTADNDAVDAPLWYFDGDGDGFGSTISMRSCDAESAYVSIAEDCNDADSTIFPTAIEICEDGVDNNCDGVDDSCSSCGDGVLDDDEEVDPPVSPFSTVDVNEDTCRWDFSDVRQLYCNGGCSWAGSSDCDIEDANIFCKLKTGNPLSTATSYSTTTALPEPGFPCPGYDTVIDVNRGVFVTVQYQDAPILYNHGPGTVIVDPVCTDP